MQAQRGGADARISALADRQHRVVAVWQLRALGVTAGAIENRTRKARLHRVYQSVYAVGTPTLTPHGHLMAAVLAYGPDAVISHRSAAALHDLRPSDQVRIDVTVPRCGIRSRERVRVHCTHRLDPADVTTVDGIPVSTVARTLLDLAGVLTRDRLLRVVETAVQLQTLNLIALDAAVARAPRRRGIRKLEAILDDYREPPDLRSRLERDFHALVRAANLPTPQTNVHVEGILVDCYWPHARLVVELDSRRFHTAAHAFEQDRIKGNVLGQLGYGLLRYTHKRVKRDRRNVIAELERMLRPLPA